MAVFMLEGLSLTALWQPLTLLVGKPLVLIPENNCHFVWILKGASFFNEWTMSSQ